MANLQQVREQPWTAELANAWAALERTAEGAACVPADRKAEAEDILEEGDENFDARRDASTWPEVHPCLFALSEGPPRHCNHFVVQQVEVLCC